MIVLGERERGLCWANRAQKIEPDDPMLLYNLACIYCRTEKYEPAIDCIVRAIDNGFTNLPWLDKDTDLDPLRDQPRFQAKIEQLRAGMEPRGR